MSDENVDMKEVPVIKEEAIDSAVKMEADNEENVVIKKEASDENLTTSTDTNKISSLATLGPFIAANRKILGKAEFAGICHFIQQYPGLAIDCELEMVRQFSGVHRLALKSILQTELNCRLRSYGHENIKKRCIKIFNSQSADHSDPTLLLRIASREGISPAGLCRAVLQEKYHLENRMQLSRLMKYPQLIDDPKLAANVKQCLCSDSQDGPLIDLRRRVVGEEYEFKLKKMAKATGMHYYDENDLRRMGYDKTPDIKIILPFLYKGEVVNWIESKANFGDVKTHKSYIQQQLNSYCNRFGPGIVIYWFGHQEETPQLTENNVGITVLDDFPDVKHLEFLNLDDTSAMDKTKTSIDEK